MLSNQKAKYIKSLQIKKYRVKHSRFLVEGAKNVQELLHAGFQIELLLSSDQFHAENERLIAAANLDLIIDKPAKIATVGSLKTNDAALAVVEMPSKNELEIGNDLVIALDDVRDPGNLGTIIRTADWYGVTSIIASNETADQYNPKVIQASMGSFSRVNVYYENLDEWFRSHREIPIAGAVLDGKPVAEMEVTFPLILLMGNESKGISQNLMQFVDQRITIPKYGSAESLNVAMSTAIICDNIRRLKISK